MFHQFTFIFIFYSFHSICTGHISQIRHSLKYIKSSANNWNRIKSNKSNNYNTNKKLVSTSIPCNEAPFSSPYFNTPAIEGQVWPLPQKIQYDRINRTIRRDGISFAFRGVRDVSCDILKFAIDTYQKKWLFPMQAPGMHGDSLVVTIHLHNKCPNLNEFPQQNMDEEYLLRVPTTGDATIEANEIWGILRGLETFSQLIFRANGSYIIRTVNVHDWPEYSIRGVLIDTSRHYLRKEIIIRQIDLMAQNKMNFLHWHIVDMESFPYVSKSFANLSNGAFTPKHIYSPNKVKDIIRYARLRGVRVMVEFDTPGHMSSWSAQPGLLAECRDKRGNIMPPAIIDPTEDKNYNFLKSFFAEILQTFPEKMIHLGGDETDYWVKDCWENNNKINEFMKAHSLNSTEELCTFYNQKFTRIIKKLLDKRDQLYPDKDGARGRPIFWDEIFAQTPDKNSIIHLWRSSNETERKNDTEQITANGYNMILSSCWYLSNIKYGHDWFGLDDTHTFYTCDPRNFNGTGEQKKLVLGGIAAMWGEYIDGTNIESTLWPRASTVAERLWSSPRDTHCAQDAWPRLHEHRCRMVARGYRASPPFGADFCLIEYSD